MGTSVDVEQAVEASRPQAPSLRRHKKGDGAVEGEGLLWLIKLTLFSGVVIWQAYTTGRLAAYRAHLLEARDRHEELQRSLEETQRTMRNSSRSMADTERERAELHFKVEEVNDLNAWLNETLITRDAALRSEQALRLSLEASVQSLKEQLNLVQGQLVTSQQQQGTLHARRGKSRH